MHFLHLLLPLLPLTTALLPTRQIYQFPLGTWVENLAVRPTGTILATILTAPDLYLIDPFSNPPTATLIHTFTTALWVAGITETTPDTFYVVVANGTIPKDIPPAPGSNRLFKVHFPTPDAQQPDVSLAATLADAVTLNGLTTLNAATVLSADSTKGVVWATNVFTGVSRVVISDPLMASVEGKLGVNGLKVYNDCTLFFTNSAQNIFAKIAIDPLNGTPVGSPATIVATAAPGTSFDDFALDVFGRAFLATAAGNTVVEVKKNGRQLVLAGDLNSTQIAEPTGVRFGRTGADRGVLYVSTAGGLAAPVDGTERMGGQVVAVDTGRDFEGKDLE